MACNPMLGSEGNMTMIQLLLQHGACPKGSMIIAVTEPGHTNTAKLFFNQLPPFKFPFTSCHLMLQVLSII